MPAWVDRQQVNPAQHESSEAQWHASDAIDLICLREIMARTRGQHEVAIGLVDGPVAMDHPGLVAENVRTITGTAAACRDTQSPACMHGTLVAGILAARRGAEAPAIAPDCTLLVRPVMSEAPLNGAAPSASPTQLAAAIVDCVDAGARLLNLSLALNGPSLGKVADVGQALEHARRRGVLIFAAAGNHGIVGSSAIIRDRWVVPVVAYSRSGRPLAPSNFGRAIGLGGVGAPGDRVSSLGPNGQSAVSSGTSMATPFVAGAAALLWSLRPNAKPADVRRALLASGVGQRRTIIPPLLNVWRAYQFLSNH
jgi:subtilisin family serine protease